MPQSQYAFMNVYFRRFSIDVIATTYYFTLSLYMKFSLHFTTIIAHYLPL